MASCKKEHIKTGTTEKQHRVGAPNAWKAKKDGTKVVKKHGGVVHNKKKEQS